MVILSEVKKAFDKIQHPCVLLGKFSVVEMAVHIASLLQCPYHSASSVVHVLVTGERKLPQLLLFSSPRELKFFLV